MLLKEIAQEAQPRGDGGLHKTNLQRLFTPPAPQEDAMRFAT
jgi:hypothetical protein